MPTTNIEALFLGPKGENEAFVRELLVEALRRHAEWRRLFGLDDADFVTAQDQTKDDFQATRRRIRDVLALQSELLKDSEPFFSPRYVGHMNWDVLISAVVAFFQASLFNPNNVARAGGPATTRLELEVGEDLCRLCGFDARSGWAHLTSCGTTANIEALWIARNMKYLPVAIREAWKQDGAGSPLQVVVRGNEADLMEQTDQDLIRGVLPEHAADLLHRAVSQLGSDRTRENAFYDHLDRYSLKYRGVRGLDLGVVFVPQSKHYSWPKVMDVLGLGREDLRFVPVTSQYRMDPDALRQAIESEERPILAVVAVVGTTEESSVDPFHRIADLREQSAHDGRAFWLHVDAAYGGYARTLFMGPQGEWLELEALQQHLADYGIINQDIPERATTTWPSRDVYDAYQALPRADSVTLDPHKLGYVPYPAGGVAYRSRQTREAIACFAPYVFERPKPGEPDELIGAYILEGSKPGAAAAAVWAVHKTLPLNITGYGRLIGETIDGAHALHFALAERARDRRFRCGGREVFVCPVLKPDLNIVLFGFNYEGNADLDVMNSLNEAVATRCFGPFPSKPTRMLERRLIVSSTDLSFEEYGTAPLDFLQRMKINQRCWQPGARVKVLRSTVMSPYLTTDYVDRNYALGVLEEFEHALATL